MQSTRDYVMSSDNRTGQGTKALGYPEQWSQAFTISCRRGQEPKRANNRRAASAGLAD